ncbi:C-terminal processing protease CtpA/Prc, contains a PDZ domain [Tenacibaculum sp. 190524A02b]|uniref:C-terminal processing protease CtpA/Prc, contains a PDZ domain n=2 Tax=Tenacibaculum vairaonense TaxID=3137860 RepID=A0ABM9PNC7_9FLAO
MLIVFFEKKQKNKIKEFMKYLSSLLLIVNLIFGCVYGQKKVVEVKEKKSITKVLKKMPNASIQETITYYYKLKKEAFNSYNFDDENELNTLGYEYLNRGEVKEAIEIFKVLISEFPKAFNPYDSLGEAYFNDKNYELSIKNYEKSLVLNPENWGAERQIFKAQQKIKEKPTFRQVFTKEQYLEDIDELAKRIEKTHPNPFEFTSKKAFYELVENQKSNIKDKMTYGQFIWQLSPIIASIGCEHSHFDVFNQEDRMLPVNLRFPIEAELVNGELLVVKAHKSKVKLGANIKAINGVSIDVITSDIFKHIASNGHSLSLKNRVFSAYITSYIPYYFDFPTSYEVMFDDNRKMQLEMLKEFEYELKKKQLKFEIVEEKNIAKLKIPTFNYYGGERLRNYKKFIDESFKKLKKQKITNLIIDIRGNGGGCSCAAIHLLQYIAKEPFYYFAKNSPLPGDKNEADIKQLKDNKFSGSIYMIINGFNTSTSGHFLSLIKQNKIATLIGEESGASYYANGKVKGFLGTNTGVAYWISRAVYTTSAKDFPRNKGIIPEHIIYKTEYDIVNKNDAELEYTLRLIQDLEGQNNIKK